MEPLKFHRWCSWQLCLQSFWEPAVAEQDRVLDILVRLKDCAKVLVTPKPRVDLMRVKDRKQPATEVFSDDAVSTERLMMGKHEALPSSSRVALLRDPGCLFSV